MAQAVGVGNLTPSSSVADVDVVGIVYVSTNSGTSAVTSAGSTVITPVSMQNIVVGSRLKIDDGSHGTTEFVIVTSVTGTTFTAPFLNTHTAGFAISDTQVRQIMAVGDGQASASIATVMSSVPVGTESGIVVRNIESIQTPGALAPSDGTTAKLLASGTHRVMRLKNTSTQTQPTVVAIYDSATVPSTTPAAQTLTFPTVYSTLTFSSTAPLTYGTPVQVKTPDSTTAPTSSSTQISFNPTSFNTPLLAGTTNGGAGALPGFKVDVINPQGQIVYTDCTQPLWVYQSNKIMKTTLDGVVLSSFTPTTTSIVAGCVGTDGNFYYIAGGFGAAKFGKCTPTGTITEFAITTTNMTAANSGSPTGICALPDGNLALTGYAGGGATMAFVVKATPAGVFTEISVPTNNNTNFYGIYSPIVLPDGLLAVAISNYAGTSYINNIAAYNYSVSTGSSPVWNTTASNVTSFNVAINIVFGPDNAIWGSEVGNNFKVTRLPYTSSAVVPSSYTEYSLSPTPNSLSGIALGYDGNLYIMGYPNTFAGGYYKITPSGTSNAPTIQFYRTPDALNASSNAGFRSAMLAPDGSIYFVDGTVNGAWYRIPTIPSSIPNTTGRITNTGATTASLGMAIGVGTGFNDTRSITYSDTNASGGSYTFQITPYLLGPIMSIGSQRISMSGSIGYYELPRPTGTRLYGALLGPSEVVDFANEQVTTGVMVQATPSAVLDGIVVDYI